MDKNQFGPLAITDGERRAEYAKRKKAYNEESFPFELREKQEAQGWSLLRENKTNIRMRVPKSIDEVLENRFWNVLYRFGYDELNVGRSFKIQLNVKDAPLTKQIDVFAKDDETVIVAECKASELPRQRSMQKDIGEFASLQRPIANAIKRHYGVSYKPKILWFFVTDKIRWAANDLERASENNIHVVQNKELLYFEEISKKLGHAARFQFHAEYLARQKVPALSGRAIPAVKTKIGGKVAYFFSALPIDILRIAFVNHRDLRDPTGAPAYQRLVNPARLKEIGAFLDGGGFFPNTILLNFHRAPTFNFKTKDDVTGVQFGEIVLPDRYKSCWVIDGQHRLYGTRFAGDSASDAPLFFIAFSGVDTAEEADIFVTINAKQTKVPPRLLAELDGEVKWNSSSIKERLAAIASRAVDLLNNQGAGPFEGKVATPGVSTTTEQPLTLPLFQQAIQQSKLLGGINARTKDFIPGPCWESNSEKSLHRLVEFLSWHFGEVEASNPARWHAGKAGHLCSNFGVAGHIRLLGELLKYVENKEKFDPAQAELSELYTALSTYLEPVLDVIKETGDEDFRERFQVPFGSGGVPRYFFALVEIVRQAHADFEPDGFEEFIQTISNEVAEQADKDVRWVQTAVPMYVLNVLRNRDGAKFFEKGVPKQIQKACQAKRIDDDVDKQLPVETYLDWLDIKKIAEDKANRPLVKEALSIKLEDDPSGRHIYFSWFDTFNEIRRIAAHPAGRHYTQADIDFLNHIVPSLRSQLPLHITENINATVS